MNSKISVFLCSNSGFVVKIITRYVFHPENKRAVNTVNQWSNRQDTKEMVFYFISSYRNKKVRIDKSYESCHVLPSSHFWDNGVITPGYPHGDKIMAFSFKHILYVKDCAYLVTIMNKLTHHTLLHLNLFGSGSFPRSPPCFPCGERGICGAYMCHYRYNTYIYIYIYII